MRRSAGKSAARAASAANRLLRRARQLQLLPAATGPSVTTPVAAAATRNLGKVLLIEDDASVRDAIIASLEAIGAGDVLVADDGRSGLELIYSNHPAVVLLDLMLPVADGFAVLEELRRQPASSRPGRIVVISGMSDAVSLQALLKLGADRVLTKPFTLNQFEAALTS